MFPRRWSAIVQKSSDPSDRGGCIRFFEPTEQGRSICLLQNGPHRAPEPLIRVLPQASKPTGGTWLPLTSLCLGSVMRATDDN